ncbi:hypothetical protein QYE76_020870 [Lolium multiflorum]|uniref:F-box domain-containing protein n=1 Tax=Lolium multiflorum TaxID=4521 RepID=A0AAD8R5L9_LOLMU|nr:hypothetical protein QYE76_020870 [Lolium multiflorum]
MAAAAAAAVASDRLSNLSNDLLVRILSFAPAREAASTTALSRRWRRPLFLCTTAVNLDYRSYTTGRGAISPLLHHYRALQDAGHALALHHHAHGRFPRKFTRDLSIEEDILLSACADAFVGLEELHLDCQDGPWQPFARRPSETPPSNKISCSRHVRMASWDWRSSAKRAPGRAISSSTCGLCRRTSCRS